MTISGIGVGGAVDLNKETRAFHRETGQEQSDGLLNLSILFLSVLDINISIVCPTKT